MPHNKFQTSNKLHIAPNRPAQANAGPQKAPHTSRRRIAILPARKLNQPRHNNDEATCAKQAGLAWITSLCNCSD